MGYICHCTTGSIEARHTEKKKNRNDVVTSSRLNDSNTKKKRDYFEKAQSAKIGITPTRNNQESRKHRGRRADYHGSDNDGAESWIESSELDSEGNQVRIFVAIYDYIPSIMS